MGASIKPEHADTALLVQDACNPAGVLYAAWQLVAETQREHGTAEACTYPPFILMLYKLADLAGVPVEYGDTWSHAYTASLDNRTAAVHPPDPYSEEGDEFYAHNCPDCLRPNEFCECEQSGGA